MKKTLRLLSSQKGFTLIESLVACGLVMILAFVASYSYVSNKNMISQGTAQNLSNVQVNNILDSVRSSVQNYQVNFQISSAAQAATLLAMDQLPMAWDVNTITTATSCATCRGRFGFIIYTMPSSPGLYFVYVRISYNSWPEKYRDYQFATSVP